MYSSNNRAKHLKFKFPPILYHRPTTALLYDLCCFGLLLLKASASSSIIGRVVSSTSPAHSTTHTGLTVTEKHASSSSTLTQPNYNLLLLEIRRALPIITR